MGLPPPGRIDRRETGIAVDLRRNAGRIEIAGALQRGGMERRAACRHTAGAGVRQRRVE